MSTSQVGPGHTAKLYLSRAHPRSPEANPVPGAPGSRWRLDPLKALVWLVLVPFFSGWFWYAVYGLIKAVVERL